jgi:hypothetical protein
MLSHPTLPLTSGLTHTLSLLVLQSAQRSIPGVELLLLAPSDSRLAKDTLNAAHTLPVRGV